MYAINRWNVTAFYVDSTGGVNGVYPGEIFELVRREVPAYVLIIPELGTMQGLTCSHRMPRRSPFSYAVAGSRADAHTCASYTRALCNGHASHAFRAPSLGATRTSDNTGTGNNPQPLCRAGDGRHLYTGRHRQT